jgi:hypothetical protein
MKEMKQVISELRKNGAELVTNVIVKNVNVKDMDAYTRVSLTLNKNVKQYVLNSDGDYELGEHNVIGVSTYSIGALLVNNKDIAFAKNVLMKAPKLLAMLLSYAEVDILLEPVKEGTEYTNPFSDKAESKIVEHNSIYVHLTDIRLGKKGLKVTSMLEDKMMDTFLNNALFDDDVSPKPKETSNDADDEE